MAQQQTTLKWPGFGRTHFPWRSKNRVDLLVDAESFYPAMLNAILSAEKSIFLEMYLVESGEITTKFIDSLLVAASRNIDVYLLFDDFGSLQLSEGDRQRLHHDNIFLTFYNPLDFGKFRKNLFRDHRKIFIVDHQRAFIGGAGIADDFLSNYQKKPGWRETMIQVQGECVADWVNLFEDAWRMYSTVPLPHPKPIIQFEENMTQACRVVCAMGSSRQGIKRSLTKRIRSAEHRIWIATAYFLPSLKIRHALIRAARRGVDVRLLLPGDKSDHPAVWQAGRRFYYRLLRAGIKIEEYQPRFLHQKILLCDQWVSIGSSNIDRWNFRWNLEANQEVEDSVFVQGVVKMLETDFSESKICDIESWQHRPWFLRIQEWFWGKVDWFLDRFI